MSSSAIDRELARLYPDRYSFNEKTGELERKEPSPTEKAVKSYASLIMGCPTVFEK